MSVTVTLLQRGIITESVVFVLLTLLFVFCICS